VAAGGDRESARTDTDVREVDISLDLLDELLTRRAESAPEGVDAFVFPTTRSLPGQMGTIATTVASPAKWLAFGPPRGTYHAQTVPSGVAVGILPVCPPRAGILSPGRCRAGLRW
jgi:hypothetical protein